MDYSRVYRILALLAELRAGPPRTADQLAEAFGVNRRTIFRDFKALEQINVPYYHDTEAGGYRVSGEFFLPPVQLTLDEAMAVTVLAERVGGEDQVPLTAPAAKAATKLRSQLPGSLREEVEAGSSAVAVRLARSMGADGVADAYALVQAALVNGTKLRCRYESANGRASGRDDEIFDLCPYRLLFEKRAWYVVGHHSGRDALRNLKLNRFTQLEPTDEGYEVPLDFSLENHLGQAWRMIRGDTRHDVELWFAPGFAETVADTHWHPTQQIEYGDDGSIVFRCTVDGLDEIVWWVLSMGPNCVVRQPAELAQRVKKLAEDTAERYA